jgi:hypothetical protein
MAEQIRQGYEHVRVITATAPTERSDGTPLDPSEISHYLWYITGAKTGLVAPIAVQLVGGAFSESFDVDAADPDTYDIYYTTVDTEGRESIPSSSLVLEILPPLAAPNPPSNVS